MISHILAPLTHLAEITIGQNGQVTGTGLYNGTTGDLFKLIANILLGLIGGISVIMVIIGGLRYTLSAGNPSATKEAKDTILNAVIGIAIALSAGIIVNFVVNKL